MDINYDLIRLIINVCYYPSRLIAIIILGYYLRSLISEIMSYFSGVIRNVR